jgi:hypothetical protein
LPTLNTRFALDYFRAYWAENKAKGLVAESHFLDYLGERERGVFRHGAWLLSPKVEENFKYRFAVFTHSECVSSSSVEGTIAAVSGDYLYSRIARFLRTAGLETMYAVPVFDGSELGGGLLADMNLGWRIFRLFDGRCQEIGGTFFSSWAGRGRPGNIRVRMTPETTERLRSLPEAQLTRLFLNEAFFTSYLKLELHVPVVDPYDVDGFFISYNGGVFPVEIKEKFPGGNGAFFGIDVGRIVMLLRLCLPSDSNALYIVRHVNDSEGRELVGWKYITLANILLATSWTGQAGGPGMGGGTTQTLLIPFGSFKDFNHDTITGDSLQSMQGLTAESQIRAREFLDAIETKYFAPRSE